MVNGDESSDENPGLWRQRDTNSLVHSLTHSLTHGENKLAADSAVGIKILVVLREVKGVGYKGKRKELKRLRTTAVSHSRNCDYSIQFCHFATAVRKRGGGGGVILRYCLKYKKSKLHKSVERENLQVDGISLSDFFAHFRRSYTKGNNDPPP